jgi:hypothetical protein
LMGSYSGKMKNYGNPRFFIKTHENRLRECFPRTRVS